MKTWNEWTKVEREMLRKNYGHLGIEALDKLLVHHSVDAIHKEASRLGVSKRRGWSEGEHAEGKIVTTRAFFRSPEGQRLNRSLSPEQRGRILALAAQFDNPDALIEYLKKMLMRKKGQPPAQERLEPRNSPPRSEP